MGNICRSPTAEAVMRGMLREHGLEDVVEVDSAGLGDWHAGQPPDHRAAAAASARGLTLEGAARAITGRDFEDYDLILAADRRNLRDLRAIAPRAAREKLHLLREFDPASAGSPDLDVPDPYYGGEDGFVRVLDLVEAACRGLLAELRAGGRCEPAGRSPRRSAARSAGRSSGPARGRRRHQRRLGRRARRRRAGVRQDARRRRAGRVRHGGGRARLARRGRRRACPRCSPCTTSHAFLALAWIDAGRLDAAGEEALGRELAALHAAGAPAFGAPPPGAPAGGLRLGALELPAATAADWPAFYAEHRLRAAPPARPASMRPDARAVEAVVRPDRRARRAARAARPPPRRPVVGQRPRRGRRPRAADRPGRARRPPRGRPRDVAPLRPPAPRTLAAYQEAHPLADGHEQRVPLWQLFPLLVHAALFGGGYRSAVTEAARRAAA